VARQTFEIQSDLTLVPGLCERMRALLTEHQVDDSDAIQVEICLVEAVNNAIEHGYRCDPANFVEVRAEVEGAGLRLEVRDRGQGFDPLRLEQALSRQPEFDEIAMLSERGRGLAIIKEVMDEVSYLRTDGVNVLRMSKQVHLSHAGQHSTPTGRSERGSNQ
jgi:serine/threonine-protein kinase RsbW